MWSCIHSWNFHSNLLDPIAIENDFINNCHSNSLIPLINKPTRNTNNIQVFSIIYVGESSVQHIHWYVFIGYNWSLKNI